MRRWRTGLVVQLLSLALAACTSTTPVPPQGTPPAASASPRGSAATMAPGSSPTASLVPGSPGATDSAPSPQPPAEPSPQAGLLLSEVRFAPTGGDPAFVEITNTSASPIDLRGASLSLDGAMLSLRSIAAEVPSGGVALVLLDGQSSADGLTLHASTGFVLEADAGVVELLDRTGLPLDRVAWGGAADAVPLTSGALIPDVIERGLSIGRAPRMTTPHEPLDWVVFGPAEVTPGAANGLPAPAVLMPFIGGILDADTPTLSWYPVPGAAGYRVQIQAEGAPSPEPAIEVATESVEIDAGARPAGAYDWTVMAIAADGTESLVSAASQFEIVASPVAVSLAAVSLAAFTDTPGTQLQVPILSQRKDTAMLLLERNVESGPHAWDAAHLGLDSHDPADNKNCALAGIAMANHFFGGDLSQDRIGYELFKGRAPGPEQDLNYGYGIPSAEVTQLLAFALGAAPTRMEPGLTPDEVWSALVASIDAGRPALAAGLTHTIVLTGYSVVSGRRTVSYNDPWTARAGKFNIDAKAGAVAAELDLWLPAAGSTGKMQEPGVTADSDGDGVVDFDEVERFHTNASSPDGDGDRVRDKQDIASSIFDPTYGYAATVSSAGRDFDFDGRVSELDADSDDGTCTDGEEDTNLDGHRNGAETWNFDTADDQCERSGAYGQVTYTSETVYDPGGSYEHTSSETLTVDVRLKEDGQGLRAFEDDGSSFRYRTTSTGIIGSDLCTIVTQAAHSAAGLIRDADGVIRGGLTPLEDEFSVAVSIPIVIEGTVDYCAFVESESVQDAAQTSPSQDCIAKIADVAARPRVYNYACHESGDGYSWSMTGSITVVP